MAFAGREHELKKLRSSVESSVEGRSRLLVVTGEAGIGKTTLVNMALEGIELRVARGECLPEGALDYAPIVEALKDLGLERIIRYSPDPELQALLVTDSSGLLLAWAGREMAVDPDIFTSMLSAVGMFVADSLAPVSTGGEYLRELRYGDYTLFITAGETFTLVAILKGPPSEYFISDLESLLTSIEEHYSHLLEDWNGDMRKMQGVQEFLQRFLEDAKDRTYSLDQKHRAQWIHTNVMKGLERFLKSEALVVVLEDIHWIDEASVALLHYLIRGLSDMPICFVATARSDEVSRNRPLAQMLNHLLREGLVETLDLVPLEREHTREILESILGDVEDDIVDLVYQRTEGIPLYVEEMAKLISQMPPDADLELIPPTMEGVVRQRLEFVEDRDLLEACAVCGYEIDVAAVADVMGMRRLAVMRSLRDIAEKTGLVELDRGGVRFHHQFERDVIYGGIPEPMRAEYESVFGEYYEGVEDFYRAAIHYHRGGEREMARECAIRAATRLEEEYAYPSALHMYRIASELSDGRERSRLLARVGKLSIVMGRWDEAEEAFMKSLEAGESADALVGLGNLLLRRGRVEEARDVFKKAIDAEAFEGSERVRAKYGVAITSMLLGETEEAERLMEEYLLEVTSRGWEREIAEALMGIGGFHWYKGDLKRAREYYEKALDISASSGMLDRVAEIHHNLCVVLGRLGLYDEAISHGKKSVEIKEKIGAISEIGTTYNSLGRIQFERGNLEDAEKYYHRALEYSRKVGDLRLEGISLSNLGILEYYAGNYIDACKHLSDAIPLRETKERSAEAESLLYLSMAWGVLGNPDNADESLKAVGAVLKDLRTGGFAEWRDVVEAFITSLREGNEEKLLAIAEDLESRGMRLHAAIAFHLLALSTGEAGYAEKAVALYREDGFLAPIGTLTEIFKSRQIVK